MLTYKLEKKPGLPLYESLYRCIRADILSGSATFYIMQNKITRIPACCRCGSQIQPEKLLQQDYLCPKCAATLSRRNSFLALMGQPSGGSL